MSSSAPSRSRSLPMLTDAEWLQSLSAISRAPARWHEALRKADIPSLARQVRERFSPLKKLHQIPTLRWSADPSIDALTIEIIDELGQLSTRPGRRRMELVSGTVEAWLDRQQISKTPSLLDQMLACLLLLESASRLTDGVLVRLWRFVEERTGQVSNAPGLHHPAVRELLITQMQFLRLIATSVLPLKQSDVQPVVETVQQFLGAFTSEAGHPAAEIHPYLGAVIASLARDMELLDRLDLRLVDKVQKRRLKALVAQAVMLFPIDCTWVPSRTPHESLDWMTRVLQAFGLSDESPLARQRKLWKQASLDSEAKRAKTQLAAPARSLLKPKALVSHQSDPSRYALLHGDWRDSRDRCVVRYGELIPTMELSVGERTLVQGDWTASVTVGDRTWSRGEWSCCCWYSDPEADFCELKWEPTPGVTVYRQLLWSRNERFLFVADEVRAPGLTGVAMESRLPLAPSWNALADGRSRECQLHQSDSVVRLYPIFSAQERVRNTDGQLSCDNQSIQTRITAPNEGVYRAFVIDWDRGRRHSAVQWGPLSIAEETQPVPSHQACGARWRVGDQLWMVLHQAVKGDSARSALGLHSHRETIVTRVSDGNYKSLVEVE